MIWDGLRTVVLLDVTILCVCWNIIRKRHRLYQRTRDISLSWSACTKITLSMLGFFWRTISDSLNFLSLCSSRPRLNATCICINQNWNTNTKFITATSLKKSWSVHVQAPCPVNALTSLGHSGIFYWEIDSLSNMSELPLLNCLFRWYI